MSSSKEAHNVFEDLATPLSPWIHSFTARYLMPTSWAPGAEALGARVTLAPCPQGVSSPGRRDDNKGDKGEFALDLCYVENETVL